MVTSIELQVISKILTSDDTAVVDELCQFDLSYYSVFRPHIDFILKHRDKYGECPDIFTFQAQFPDVTLVTVSENLEFLQSEMRRNKQHLLLIETFNKLKDLGSGDVEEAWQYLANQCDKVEQLDSTAPLDIVHDAKKRADQVVEYSKQARIPTGFDEIDKLMYGGLSTVEELVILLARTNTGKAQPLWSKVLTPSGWTTMGQLKVGDVVVGENNDFGRVVQIFPQGVKDYYRVTFDDNTSTECCDDHLWKVLDAKRRERANRNYGQHEILTLKDIRENMDRRYTVDVSDAIEFKSQFDESKELDGYLLGVILGDGGLRDGRVTISNESNEIWSRIVERLEKYHCHRSGKDLSSIVGDVRNNNFVRDKIIEYGLMGKKSIDKYIPKQYLTAPVSIRLALLAGLVDTDGYMPKEAKQCWEFDTASEQLARDFAELARSLGVKVKVHTRVPSAYTKNGVRKEASGIRHLVCRSEFNPFWLTAKAERFSCRTTAYNHSMPKRHAKRIVSVEHIGQTECQCILLDNKTHTYITDDYIVTHNTWVCTKMMESAQRHGFPVLYYSPEMQSAYLGTRFDTWRAHFQNSQLYQGKYDEAYFKYLKDLEQDETSAFILEDRDMAKGEVSVRALSNLVKKYGIKLLIVDGLSYMADDQRSDTDYMKYKNICLDLFKLSKRYGCAVVVATQANRETKESKDDKGDAMPTLYNLEGSDHPGRICTQAFSLRQVFDKHVLDIRLEKSRIANNQKPMLSYAWDVNTGNMQYLPGGQDDPVAAVLTPPDIKKPLPSNVPTGELDDDDLDTDDVEF